jgi:hypothetical protein
MTGNVNQEVKKMFTRNTLRLLTAFGLVLSVLLMASILLAQKAKPKKKDPKPVPEDAKAVLWREPTDIASRDLFLGEGGEAMKPDLTEVTFVSDETRSYSTKYRVRDGAGKEWVVKLGKEAQPETAAVRLVWAAGYFADITYLVPSVEIKGKGTFENARFEARPKGIKRLGQRWDWSKNPFVGTQELQGLKVLMALVGNWDIQNHNNNILLVKDKETGESEVRYFDTDLGASFAREGRFHGHTRNQPDQYVKAKFIKGVDHGFVRFDYNGKNQHLLKEITVAQAKWLGNILSQLSDQQISDAFRAANYTPEEIQELTQTVKARIEELKNLPG